MDRYFHKMILFPEIGIMGRLGNQLFQVAAMKTLSLRNNIPCFLPSDLEERQQHGQKCLLNNFEHGIPFLRKEDYEKPIGKEYQENDWDFAIDPEYFSLKGPLRLKGYFQSEQYFTPYQDEIRKMFTLKKEIQNNAEDYIHKIREKHQKPIVAIHIRLGDYMNLGLRFPEVFKYVDYVVQTYFSDKDYYFLIFTGGNTEGDSNRKDIEICENTILADSKYTICDVNSTVLDLAIMSLCDSIVLTTKSTLGWWAAYLNKNPHKKIYVPETSYVDKLKIIPDVLWPKDFIRVKV